MLAPAKAAIKAFLLANFTAAPLVFPNEPAVAPDQPALFVAVEVWPGKNLIHAFGEPGSRLWLHPGMIALHVFAPINTGEETADGIIDTLGTLLQRIDIHAPSATQIVRTEDPSQDLGEQDERFANYWRISLKVPFNFYYFA